MVPSSVRIQNSLILSNVAEPCLPIRVKHIVYTHSGDDKRRVGVMSSVKRLQDSNSNNYFRVKQETTSCNSSKINRRRIQNDL